MEMRGLEGRVALVTAPEEESAARYAQGLSKKVSLS
jgi:hypothetical protein